jgi:hypothetical protein
MSAPPRSRTAKNANAKTRAEQMKSYLEGKYSKQKQVQKKLYEEALTSFPISFTSFPNRSLTSYFVPLQERAEMDGRRKTLEDQMEQMALPDSDKVPLYHIILPYNVT